jgi:hypothetical protein
MRGKVDGGLADALVTVAKCAIYGAVVQIGVGGFPPRFDADAVEEVLVATDSGDDCFRIARTI